MVIEKVVHVIGKGHIICGRLSENEKFVPKGKVLLINGDERMGTTCQGIEFTSYGDGRINPNVGIIVSNVSNENLSRFKEIVAVEPLDII